MIFVCVGTQLGFDRLVKCVDNWAQHNEVKDIFFQIGTGAYTPAAGSWERHISKERFDSLLAKSTFIVSHAGMGTVISCMLTSKPLIVLPRRVDLGEHRNDHQIATSKRLSLISNCKIANDTTELATLLDGISSFQIDCRELAYPLKLIGNLEEYINGL